MDQSIKSFVNNYLEQYDLKSKGEATDLEKFANYCVFYSYQNHERFNISNVHVGGKSKDAGFDGIGIIVNDQLLDVENENELDREVEKPSKLNITFIFTQIKSANEYNRKDILDIFEGINDFFSERPIRQRHLPVEKKAKLALHLLTKWTKKIRQSPTCIIYYITNARNKPSQAIQELIDKKKSELQEKCETTGFERVEVSAWGCDDLRRVYQRTIHQVETTVTSTSTLGDLVGKRENPIFIQGVKKAFIANLRFSEFKKIIMDESDNIIPFIFYDNIRGFLGEDNQVNNQIKMTLDSDHRNRFAILNNGVTIIAHNVNQNLNALTITDYQIVNGCQTSYVLYNWYKENYEKLSSELDEVVIPVKIIETDNDEVRNAIIKATNSQT
ncbi:MAG: AIPR family protein, partial [Phormidium sp.]